MSEHAGSRAERLDRAICALLSQAPEVEAAAVVSFDGLPMASALPDGMDEDRVAAMSAALLSLGERAAQGLGRGELSQVYIEGETGTVFLLSCDNEAVLVAVGAAGAKVGMVLYEVRRAAAAVAQVLRADEPVFAAHVPSQGFASAYPAASAYSAPAESTSVPAVPGTPAAAAVPAAPLVPAGPDPLGLAHLPGSSPLPSETAYEPAPAWSSYAPATSVLPGDPLGWS